MFVIIRTTAARTSIDRELAGLSRHSTRVKISFLYAKSSCALYYSFILICNVEKG
jgi:hypothetical protein